MNKTLKLKLIYIFISSFFGIWGNAMTSDTLHINLEQAEQLALKANPDYKIATLSRTSGKLNFYEQLTSNVLKPQVQVSYSGDSLSSLASDNYNFEFSLNQPVFNIQQASAILQSKSASSFSNEACKQAKNLLFYNIENFYFLVLKAQKLVELRQKAIENATDNMKLVEKKLRVDKASRLDSLNAEVQLNRTKLDYSTTQKNYELAKNTLLSALGIYNRELSLEPIEVEENYTLSPLDTFIAIGLKHAPLIKEAQEELTQNKLNFYTSVAGLLPSISFRWLWTSSESEWHDRFSEIKNSAVKTSGWYGILNLDLLSYPFEVGKSKTALSKSELDLLNQRVQVVNAIKSAYLDCKEANENLSLTNSTFLAATEADRLAKTQYEIGLISALDLFNVTTNKLEAEINYIASTYDYKLAKTELQYATGLPDTGGTR